jgi:hypothetical protein
MNGVYIGWAVIEAESEAKGRLVVAPLVRGQASVIKVTKFVAAILAELHQG